MRPWGVTWEHLTERTRGLLRAHTFLGGLRAWSERGSYLLTKTSRSAYATWICVRTEDGVVVWRHTDVPGEATDVRFLGDDALLLVRGREVIHAARVELPDGGVSVVRELAPPRREAGRRWGMYVLPGAGDPMVTYFDSTVQGGWWLDRRLDLVRGLDFRRLLEGLRARERDSNHFVLDVAPSPDGAGLAVLLRGYRGYLDGRLHLGCSVDGARWTLGGVYQQHLGGLRWAAPGRCRLWAQELTSAGPAWFVVHDGPAGYERVLVDRLPTAATRAYGDDGSTVTLVGVEGRWLHRQRMDVARRDERSDHSLAPWRGVTAVRSNVTPAGDALLWTAQRHGPLALGLWAVDGALRGCTTPLTTPREPPMAWYFPAVDRWALLWPSRQPRVLWVDGPTLRAAPAR